MYSLTIRQDYHTEKPVLHFRYLHPTPNPAICLYNFPNRRPYGSLDPFVQDYGSVRSNTNCFKVARNLHTATVSDFRSAGLSYNLLMPALVDTK